MDCFIERKPSSFGIEFTLNAQDFHMEWSRCSLLAGYIARYMTAQSIQQARTENLVSTVVNGLLETVVGIAPNHSDIDLHCFQEGDGFVLDVRHSLHAQSMEPFQDFVKLLSGDIQDIPFNEPGTCRDLENPLHRFGQAMRMHDLLDKVVARLDRDMGAARIQVRLPVEMPI